MHVASFYGHPKAVRIPNAVANASSAPQTACFRAEFASEVRFGRPTRR